MVIISFPNGTDWYKANWVYRQIVEDVVALFPGDAELKFLVEQGMWCGGLAVERMETEAANKAMKALRLVAEGTVEGRIEGWKRTHPDDPDGQRM